MLINYHMCTWPELFYKQTDDILALMRKIARLHETSLKVNEKKKTNIERWLNAPFNVLEIVLK